MKYSPRSGYVYKFNMEDFNNLSYYQFLNLDPHTLPKPTSRDSRIILKQILDQRFRDLAPKCHPDRGGNPEEFKFLLRAVTILGDESLRRAYDGESESGFDPYAFNVDWEKYFNYNPDSLAADFGHQAAMKIAQKADCKILFYPQKKEDGYIWNFEKFFENKSLTLSLVYNEDEILALTDGNETISALPFKVHIYYPLENLMVNYNHHDAIKIPGSDRYLITPIPKTISYGDITLLSTTNENNFINYVSNQLVSDIADIDSGKLENIGGENVEIKNTKDQEKFRREDREMLEEIFKIKTPKLAENLSAADFIKNIKSKPITRITEKVIKIKK